MTENAVALADFLHNHPKIADVYYPGLPPHSGHEVAKRQMSGYGSLLSVRVNGGRDEALKVVGKLQLFLRATSLGGV
jgi:cystathionine gamma-synthase